MYSVFAVKLSLLIIIGHLGSANCQQCMNFNSSLLSSMCGYNHTVRFRDKAHFNESYAEVLSGAMRHMIFPIFGNCSDYSSIIHCSISLPRCSEGLNGPYLPCKPVCEEYLKGCQNEIVRGNEDWIVGLCQALPEYDDPKTTKGYQGRCFEPPGFKPSSGGTSPFKCSKLIVPQCQGFGYDETILSEGFQQRRAIENKYRLDMNVTTYLGEKCGKSMKQLDCMNFFPPCKDDKMQFMCRHKCEKMLEACKSFNISENDCLHFAEGDSASDFCFGHWPLYEKWPNTTKTATRMSKPGSHKTEPYTSKTGTRPTDPYTRKTGTRPTDPYTRKTGTRPTENPSAGATTSHSHARKVVIGIVVSLVVVLIVALALVGFLFYRKRRAKQFGYEKHMVYNANLIDREGE